MKTALKALSAVALLGTLALQPAFADDATTPAPTDPKDQKDLKKVIEDQGINYVETAQKGITLSGYVDTSYTYQFAGAGEYANSGLQNPGGGPANTHAALRQFDTSNNTFNINAVKIALEKALPDKNEWAAGFRIDTIYGEDAKYLGDTALNGTSTAAVGTNNNSGLALEQALVKFRIPIGNGLDIYAGKFVTFLGYEVIESPANLNFSRGLLFTNLIPLTHTGIYADYKFNNILEAKLGIVDGWNNSTSPSVGASGITGTMIAARSEKPSRVSWSSTPPAAMPTSRSPSSTRPKASRVWSAKMPAPSWCTISGVIGTRPSSRTTPFSWASTWTSATTPTRASAARQMLLRVSLCLPAATTTATLGGVRRFMRSTSSQRCSASRVA